jgi:hypothetical protein
MQTDIDMQLRATLYGMIQAMRFIQIGIYETNRTQYIYLFRNSNPNMWALRHKYERGWVRFVKFPQDSE